jgi:hypothetical protein
MASAACTPSSWSSLFFNPCSKAVVRSIWPVARIVPLIRNEGPRSISSSIPSRERSCREGGGISMLRWSCTTIRCSRKASGCSRIGRRRLPSLSRKPSSEDLPQRDILEEAVRRQGRQGLLHAVGIFRLHVGPQQLLVCFYSHVFHFSFSLSRRVIFELARPQLAVRHRSRNSKGFRPRRSLREWRSSTHIWR